jgi:hypothetical protein
VAVNSSIKVGPLVFLLKMFVITEDIMKRPVDQKQIWHNYHCNAEIVVYATQNAKMHDF